MSFGKDFVQKIDNVVFCSDSAAIAHCDSSVGRASDRRSGGPQFDPGSRQVLVGVPLSPRENCSLRWPTAHLRVKTDRENVKAQALSTCVHGGRKNLCLVPFEVRKLLALAPIWARSFSNSTRKV